VIEVLPFTALGFFFYGKWNKSRDFEDAWIEIR
jgi:hypothetical protein